MSTYDVRMLYTDADGLHNVTVQVQADDRTAATFKAQRELNRTRGVFKPSYLAVTEVEK